MEGAVDGFLWSRWLDGGAAVARSMEEHVNRHPPASVTLPWRAVDGAPATASLIFHRDHGRPINRNDSAGHQFRTPHLHV